MISHFDLRRKIILCSKPYSLCVHGFLRHSLVDVRLEEVWSSLGLDLVTDPREKWTIFRIPLCCSDLCCHSILDALVLPFKGECWPQRTSVLSTWFMGSLDYDIQAGPTMKFPGRLRESLEAPIIHRHLLKTCSVLPQFFLSFFVCR